MAALYKTIYPTKYLRDYLSQDLRPDGREFLNFRPVTVNVSSVSQADSSSIIKFGNTTVICGIKAELATPSSKEPENGYIIPNVGLSPLCSTKFRPGPPSDQAQVITQLIDDAMKNSQAINLHDLCICKNELAWVLYCDIECVDCDGSLIDACMAALMAALATLTLPEVTYKSAIKSIVVHPSNRKSIRLERSLISTTFVVFNNDLMLVDPTDDEEIQSLARFTVTIDNGQLCGIHKPGGIPLSPDLLLKSLAISRARAAKLQELINTAIKEK